MSPNEIKTILEEKLDTKIKNLEQLPASGSARKNYIVSTNDTFFVLTENNNLPENKSFIYFSKLFSHLKLNTPEIIWISDDQQFYLQSFLGKETLSEVISKEGSSERVKSLVKQTLQRLYELQVKTNDLVDYSQTFEYEAYNEIPILHDLFYFKFMFVDVVEVTYHKTKLIQEFKKLVSEIENLEPKGLMIRDFQARNIMVDSKDQVFFIDYQSAMYGPLLYDVTSFLFQAKANFNDEFRNEMLSFYYSLWENPEIEQALQQQLAFMKLIRFLQVLGVYGFRGLVQKKSHFIQSIPQAVENIYQFSAQWEDMNLYPELKSVINQLHDVEFQIKIDRLLSS